MGGRRRWGPKRFTIMSDGERVPYMTRWTWGRLRLHVFHRGDADPDPHNHPWDFVTVPLTPYVEEVCTVRADGGLDRRLAVVRSWRPHFRGAGHTHRVLGRWAGTGTDVAPGRIVTLVATTGGERDWGFLKERGGRTCFSPWRDYIFGGGRDAPCAPGPEARDPSGR